MHLSTSRFDAFFSSFHPIASHYRAISLSSRPKQVRVAQQLIGPRGKSERDAASAFPDIESLIVEEGEYQYRYQQHNMTT